MSDNGIETVYRHLGKALRAARKAKNMRQVQVAEHVGLSKPSISLIEKGRQRIMLHDLPKFAAVLGVKPTELLPPEWSA